jgi:hypothetical protein
MHSQVVKHEIALIKAGVKAYQADAKKQMAVISANEAVAATRAQVGQAAAQSNFNLSLLGANTSAEVGALTAARSRAQNVFQ